jgi:toxin YoeB
MVQKGVTWSDDAKEDIRAILKYWRERNRSDVYGKRLFDLFQKAIILIQAHPGIGTTMGNRRNTYRQKVVKNYTIVYKVLPDEIHVDRIWSPKRNPEDLFGH